MIEIVIKGAAALELMSSAAQMLKEGIVGAHRLGLEENTLQARAHTHTERGRLGEE